MSPSNAKGPRILTGDDLATLFNPDNDNWGVRKPWQTPAEALQDIRQLKEEIRQEFLADFRLRSCPKHRRHWESINAAEQCCLWHYYRDR